VSANPLLTWTYYLGEPLLRFILNKDSGSLDDLSDGQRQVLYDLDSGGVLGPRDDPRPPVALSATEGEQLPPAWRLRQRCGGRVPEPSGNDEATRSLTRIARDVYCILLSPPDLTVNSGPGRSLPASDPLIAVSQRITAHPTNVPAKKLIAAEAQDWMDVLVESAISRRRLTEKPTPDSVIGAAAERWRHLPNATADDFMQTVADCLAELRRLGTGESVEAPAAIGLRGLKLEDGLECELPTGVLRQPTDGERHYSPFFDDGPEVEAVLAVSIKLRPSPVGDPEPDDPGRSQLQLARIGRTISLASALARRNQEAPQSAAAIAWITEATPLQGSGAFKPGPISQSWVPSISYEQEDIKALGAWVERIEAAKLSHVEIAIERLLRALFEVEPGESLIDAVIAWESLLGTRNETVYRVTAGLAVLCEDDPRLRMERRKELQGIYDKRSRIVHGDIVGVDSELRNRAIQIGLDALSRMIKDRPALLELAKSQKRVDRLLLAIPDSESLAGELGSPDR
jgi:hypothetical protein